MAQFCKRLIAEPLIVKNKKHENKNSVPINL